MPQRCAYRIMKLERITFDHYSKFLPFFEQQHYELCAYTLPSIIAWSTREYQPYAAVAGDAMVVGAEFVTRKNNRHLILPLPRRPADLPPEYLRDLAERLGFDKYWFVPEDYLNRYGRQRIAACFRIDRQRHLDDYIYRTADLARLRGNRYAKKRNLIRQFEKKHLDRGGVAVERITAANAEECIAFLDKWCEQMDCDYDREMDLACERQAAVNMIGHIDAIGAEGVMIRVGGEASAFGIGCRLTDDMGVLHFEKAFSHIKGLYQFLDRLCAQRLFNGVGYLNKESDMGLAGLKQAKRSYHPVRVNRSFQLDVR